MQANCFCDGVVIFLNYAHCRTSRSRQLDREYKSIYLDQFKLTYFRQILIRGYNSSNAIQEIINADHSGFMEPILTSSDYAFIDQMALKANAEMQADSTEGNQRAEGSQGKRPLGFILQKLKTKWLDSIANKRYKISGLKGSYYDE